MTLTTNFYLNKCFMPSTQMNAKSSLIPENLRLVSSILYMFLKELLLLYLNMCRELGEPCENSNSIELNKTGFLYIAEVLKTRPNLAAKSKVQLLPLAAVALTVSFKFLGGLRHGLSHASLTSMRC